MAVDKKIAPADFETLRTAIVEQRTSLPKRLMQVAAYALDHPDDVAFGTTASISASAGVQPSTLVRFAQTLGFDGFSGLQQIFQDRLKSKTSSYDERLRQLEADKSDDSSSNSTLKGFVAAAHQSLDRLSAAIDPQSLEDAIEILARADKIYLIARRRSYPIASALAYTFGKLKVRCLVVSSAIGNDDDLLALATSMDAAIAVSFAPYAPESIDQAKALTERRVPVVAITDSALSPLSASARVWFELAEADHGGFRSLSASMAFATALAVNVAERRRQI